MKASGIQVKLLQMVKFEARPTFGKSNVLTKLCSREVATVLHKKIVDSQSSHNWENGILKIPPICASSNKNNGIIDISYNLELSFKMPGLSGVIHLRIPITIGY